MLPNTSRDRGGFPTESSPAPMSVMLRGRNPEIRERKSLRHVGNIRLCHLLSPLELPVQQKHRSPGVKNGRCCCTALTKVMSPLGAARPREEETGEGRALRSTCAHLMEAQGSCDVWSHSHMPPSRWGRLLGTPGRG